MRARAHGCTDTGRRRSHNEDAYRVDEKLGLFIVCDGVGGRARGEIASDATVEYVWEWVKAELPPLLAQPAEPARTRRLETMLRRAIQHACYMVHSMAELNPDRRGMSTTATVLLLVDELAIIGQVGDSRVYRCRGVEIRQLTEDHTLVALQIKQGMITDVEARGSRMRRLITRAVGQKDYVEVDVHSQPVVAGDRFLLCSDGLHESIDTSDGFRELFAERDLKVAAQRAIDLANAAGGDDNITALFVDCV